MSEPKIDLMEAISLLAREKDMNEEVLIDTIEEALKAAYRRNNRQSGAVIQNLVVRLSRKEGAQVFLRKVVADEVEEPDMQISLEKALAINPNYHVGDIVEIDVTPDNFGRVAAQTAKQMLVQKIREAERGKIYDEYIEKENEILTGIVQRVEPKATYLELGRTEGIMESSEYIPGESYRDGDHLKVYVLKVRRSGSDYQRAPQVYVSRIHPGLVRRLFEMEVPEIATGVVQIRSTAREAGSRTKIAVYSMDPMIDPVGACVAPAAQGWRRWSASCETRRSTSSSGRLIRLNLSPMRSIPPMWSACLFPMKRRYAGWWCLICSCPWPSARRDKMPAWPPS